MIFANKSADWGEKQWVKVLFSDESTIQQFGTRKQQVRRPVGTCFKDRYTVATMKHPPSVMILGCNVIKWNCGALISAERNHHERSQIPRDVARKAAITRHHATDLKL